MPKMKLRIEYITSIISIFLILSYLLGYYVFYYTEIGLVDVLIIPSMFWFISCIAIAPIHFMISAYRYFRNLPNYKYHAFSGTLVVISFMVYWGLVQLGFVITV